MKNVISFCLGCLTAILIIIFFSLEIDFYRGNSRNSIKIDGVRLTGVAQEERKITTTEDIIFKCDLSHEIWIDESGDFMFKSKDGLNPIDDIVISCNKNITKVYYYSYDDEYIYCYNNKKGNEWIEIYQTYCKKDCYYAIIFIEDGNKIFYAKFTREDTPE